MYLIHGPDKLLGSLLKSLAKEITPIVHFIFTQSLCTSELPTEWTQDNVAHIFKKGSKLQAVNYRPVSLTCITCKQFEHIICKHILAHLRITQFQQIFNMASGQEDHVKLN